MDGDHVPFSSRFGFRGPDAEITIRQDAPTEVRDAIVMIASGIGLGPGSMREAVCEVLRRRPDQGNWSPSNIEREVSSLIDDAPWFRIYDLVEKLYKRVGEDDFTGVLQGRFTREINEAFRELGVGWELKEGVLIARGSEAFAMATQDAVSVMSRSGAPTAAKEVHEALKDISRRPDPDVSGAIQHAMAALECVARQIDGSDETLGKIINRLPLPPILQLALHKLWGFTSQEGRHIMEGRPPQFEEAELVVTTAAAVSVYLLRLRAREHGAH